MASIGTFNFDGLASGLDTKSIISKMLSIDRMPLTRLQRDKANFNAKLPILQQLNTLFLGLKNRSSDLKLQSAFQTRKGSSTDTTKVTTSVAADAPVSTNTIDSVTRLATATRATSAVQIGGTVDTGASLSGNGMRTAITAGTFTINGTSFLAESTDTLDTLIGKINAQSGATGAEALYDAGTDKLILRNVSGSDNSTILLGASGDSSNFLTVTGVLGAFQDTSTGRTTMESGVHLGAVDKTQTLAASNFATAVTSGDFRINGVTISVDSGNDSLEDVVARINDSAAGVTATYNTFTDKVEIASKTTGATSINFTSGTSNFVAASGLTMSGGTGTGISLPPAVVTDTVSAVNTLDVPVALVNGTITVTGWKASQSGIAINATDSIDGILAKINAVSGTTGATASYAGGVFTFVSTNPLKTNPISVTSNTGNFTTFASLTAAVNDPATGSLASTDPLVESRLIDTTDTLGTATFATPIQFTGGTAGRLSLTHDGVTKTFDYDATTVIDDLLAAITADADLKVDAYYDNVADQIVFTGKAGTSALVGGEDLSVAGSSGNLGAAIGLNPYVNSQTAGVDAEYQLNGLTYYSSSNTIADKIEGVTFTLAATTDSAVTLKVTSSADDARTRIKSFVTDYNSTIQQLTSLISDPSGVYYNDPSLRDILNRLRSSANTYVGASSGDYKSLGDIGITSGGFGMAWTEGYIGKLEIDEAKLSAALAADPDAVQKMFFLDPNGGVDYRHGVGRVFENIMAPLTEAGGMIALNEGQINRQIDDVTQRISDMEKQLQVKESYYRSIFSTLEVNMGQLQRQSQWVSQQLGSLGSFGGMTKS